MAKTGIPIQRFEEEDFEMVKRSAGTGEYEILTEPAKKIIKVVCLSPTKNVSTLRHLSYETAWWSIKPSTAPAKQGIRIYAGLRQFPMPNVKISLFNLNTGEKITEATTNEDGYADVELTFRDPADMTVVCGLGDRVPLLPTVNPFADVQPLAVWFVVVKATAIKDRWARYAGRAIGEPLPYRFWREKPRTVLGVLGIRYTFADLVPVFGSQSLSYEVGVSAYCDTPDPSPTHEECCAPENAAWWDVKVYATKNPKNVKDVLQGKSGLVGGDRINIDYHLKYTITTAGITYDGRYLVKRRCEWEV